MKDLTKLWRWSIVVTASLLFFWVVYLLYLGPISVLNIYGPFSIESWPKNMMAIPVWSIAFVFLFILKKKHETVFIGAKIGLVAGFSVNIFAFYTVGDGFSLVATFLTSFIVYFGLGLFFCFPSGDVHRTGTMALLILATFGLVAGCLCSPPNLGFSLIASLTAGLVWIVGFFVAIPLVPLFKKLDNWLSDGEKSSG